MIQLPTSHQNAVASGSFEWAWFVETSAFSAVQYQRFTSCAHDVTAIIDGVRKDFSTNGALIEVDLPSQAFEINPKSGSITLTGNDLSLNHNLRESPFRHAPISIYVGVVGVDGAPNEVNEPTKVFEGEVLDLSWDYQGAEDTLRIEFGDIWADFDRIRTIGRGENAFSEAPGVPPLARSETGLIMMGDLPESVEWYTYRVRRASRKASRFWKRGKVIRTGTSRDVRVSESSDNLPLVFGPNIVEAIPVFLSTKDISANENHLYVSFAFSMGKTAGIDRFIVDGVEYRPIIWDDTLGRPVWADLTQSHDDAVLFNAATSNAYLALIRKQDFDGYSKRCSISNGDFTGWSSDVVPEMNGLTADQARNFRGRGVVTLLMRFTDARKVGDDGQGYGPESDFSALLLGAAVENKAGVPHDENANPANVLYHYLTDPFVGKGADKSKIDDASFVAAGAIYAEKIYSGIDHPRNSIRGVVDTGESLLDNVSAIADSAMSTLCYTSEGISLVAMRNPALGEIQSISRNDIVGEVSFASPKTDNRFNKVVSQYETPDGSMIATFPRTGSAIYNQWQTQDNGRALDTEVSLQFCGNNAEAGLIAAVTAYLSRQGVEITVNVTGASALLEVGDYVNIDLPEQLVDASVVLFVLDVKRQGISNAQLKLHAQMTITSGALVPLFREHDDADAPLGPPRSSSSSFALVAPENLRAESAPSTSTATSRIAWDPVPYASSYRVRVMWTRPDQTEVEVAIAEPFDPFFDMVDLSVSGTYDVSVSAVRGLTVGPLAEKALELEAYAGASGKDGATLEYRFQNGATPPVGPDDTVVEDADLVALGWKLEPESIPDGQKRYFIIGYRRSATEIDVPPGWTDPVEEATGGKGDPGETGRRGTIHVDSESDFGFSDEAAKQRALTAIIENELADKDVTPKEPISRDTVTLYKLANEGSGIDGRSESYVYDGASWARLSQVIDGNLLVKGSVSLGSLYADGRLVVTGDNATVTINGDDGPFVIEGNTAPIFSVGDNSVSINENAVVTGKIIGLANLKDEVRNSFTPTFEGQTGGSDSKPASVNFPQSGDISARYVSDTALSISPASDTRPVQFSFAFNDSVAVGTAGDRNWAVAIWHRVVSGGVSLGNLPGTWEEVWSTTVQGTRNHGAIESYRVAAELSGEDASPSLVNGSAEYALTIQPPASATKRAYGARTGFTVAQSVEGAKIDLSGYGRLAGDQIWTGVQTFNNSVVRMTGTGNTAYRQTEWYRTIGDTRYKGQIVTPAWGGATGGGIGIQAINEESGDYVQLNFQPDLNRVALRLNSGTDRPIPVTSLAQTWSASQTFETRAYFNASTSLMTGTGALYITGSGASNSDNQNYLSWRNGPSRTIWHMVGNGSTTGFKTGSNANGDYHFSWTSGGVATARARLQAPEISVTSNSGKLNLGTQGVALRNGGGASSSLLLGGGAAQDTYQIYLRPRGVDSSAAQSTVDWNGNWNFGGGDLYLGQKVAFRYVDSWLRINDLDGFTSGVFFGNSTVRFDSGDILFRGATSIANGIKFGATDKGSIYATSGGDCWFGSNDQSRLIGIDGGSGIPIYWNGSAKEQLATLAKAQTFDGVQLFRDGILVPQHDGAYINPAMTMDITDRRGLNTPIADYPRKAISTFFDNSGVPKSGWHSGFVVKGWSSGYNGWSIAGNSNTTGGLDQIYYRTTQDGGGAWKPWRTIACLENIQTFTANQNVAGVLQANDYTGNLSRVVTMGDIAIDNDDFWEGNIVEAFAANIFAFGVATGNVLQVNGSISAGTGTASAHLSGSGTYRIWAGGSVTGSASAPFRVNSSGKVFSRDFENIGVMTVNSAAGATANPYVKVVRGWPDYRGNPRAQFVRGRSSWSSSDSAARGSYLGLGASSTANTRFPINVSQTWLNRGYSAATDGVSVAPAWNAPGTTQRALFTVTLPRYGAGLYRIRLTLTLYGRAQRSVLRVEQMGTGGGTVSHIAVMGPSSADNNPPVSTDWLMTDKNTSTSGSRSVHFAVKNDSSLGVGGNSLAINQITVDVERIG
ncbi:hypothetical protein [Ferrimonas balearica]|uniref:hypothetical protein n=1 Tax=Ferrimonas balearica TaxID=44012 RepID=UPI001C98F90F|nr:hypothetical protein [Ferrimonas balearica]MBY5992517.1 hypothetical protein [Ferrimonas balearica]